MTPRPARRVLHPQRKYAPLKQNLKPLSWFLFLLFYHFDNKRTKNKNYNPRISAGWDAEAAQPTGADTPDVPHLGFRAAL